MKFLEILKKFDKAIVTENKKLQSIYESLIADAEADIEETDDIEEACNEAAEDEMEEFIAQAFTSFTGHMLLAFFILLVIGIIITVVSSRLIDAMKRVESDEVYTEPGLE